MGSLSIASQRPVSWLRRYGIIFALVFSHLAMTMLVIEQGRVIESQRKLIRLLFSDSTELSALKIKNNQERHQH